MPAHATRYRGLLVDDFDCFPEASQNFGSRIDETGMFGVRLLPAELDSTILHMRLGQKCVTNVDPSYYLFTQVISALIR